MGLDKLNVCQSDTIAEGFHVPLATFAKLSENVGALNDRYITRVAFYANDYFMNVRLQAIR